MAEILSAQLDPLKRSSLQFRKYVTSELFLHPYLGPE